MAEIICYANGKYNIYGTIADAFYYEGGLDIEQLRYVIQDRHGLRGIEKLGDRLDRAHKNGHSGIYGEPLEEFLCYNRAGDNEETLSYDECLKRFFS